MFQSARIKLTAWYLFIITLISISFSVVVYKILTSELDRVQRMQQYRVEHRYDEEIIISRSTRPIDEELIEETKHRLILILMLINFGIIGISAVAGYFLAGRTLLPIRKNLDEQNRFITDASHELRTPITSLKTSTEVFLRDKKHSLKEADNLFESNLEEINNLQTITNNLIKLAQYQKPNQIIAENLLVRDLVDESIKKVSNLASHKNIKLKKQLKEFSLVGEKQSLTEVLVILLDNAIKYSPKNSTITIKSIKSHNLAMIEITDQGIGIDKADIDHLFDRFYRADKSRTKTDIKGYGLGLSIAREIIDRHSGVIKVKSKVNKGSTFTILLPVKRKTFLPQNVKF
jgi:two-component system, OmpR family, sensor histidine kinase CiaH